MKIKYILIIITCLLTFNNAKAQYNIQCEDTCSHIHGLDMSHYQGDVWWETVAQNSNHKLNYVYLKASEGGSRIDQRYLDNIEAAQRYGMNVGSYHFYRPAQPQAEQGDERGDEHEPPQRGDVDDEDEARDRTAQGATQGKRIAEAQGRELGGDMLKFDTLGGKDIHCASR